MIERAVRILGLGVLCAAACAIASACNNDPKNGNGVNDVRAACDIRVNWVRVGNDCSVCESAVVSPRCDCSSLAEFSGACNEQQDARKGACSEAIDRCVYDCDRKDCACIDQCYANDANCKSASAARDGCITETCASHCK